MRVKVVERSNVDAKRLRPGGLEDPNERDGATVVPSTLLDDSERGRAINAQREAVSLDGSAD